MKFTVGTRGSRLALRQVEIVTQGLKEKFPGLKIEAKVIKTSGDWLEDKPLVDNGEKGVFSKAIDEAVLRGEVSFAVHSLKDLPTELSEGTTIVAVPERASPHDVLVSKRFSGLDRLPAGAVIGTSSPRRKAQILHLRSDLTVRPIRGNVDTRLTKMEEGQYDAVVLAEAGLVRLDRGKIITERLSLRDFTPSAGQGALAIVSLEGNEEVNEVLRSITHAPSMTAVLAERAFVRAFGGGCRVPMGVTAYLGRDLELCASVLSPDGGIKTQIHKAGDPRHPEKLGEEAARDLLAQGAAVLIERWR